MFLVSLQSGSTVDDSGEKSIKVLITSKLSQHKNICHHFHFFHNNCSVFDDNMQNLWSMVNNMTVSNKNNSSKVTFVEDDYEIKNDINTWNCI